MCPEAEFRASLSDGEFWDYVFNGVRPGDPRPDDYDPDDDLNAPPSDRLDLTPCAVCGGYGACGYDDEGRALIHATPEEDDD